ncbi:hypothetical protein V8J36_11980 [Frigidibacter sp. MR17.14]|uniref:hypothetical protein n=1 Tax=Frigidibacter sp. MR17.14 TaxID=3126509 RepID=UPI0030131555
MTGILLSPLAEPFRKLPMQGRLGTRWSTRHRTGMFASGVVFAAALIPPMPGPRAASLPLAIGLRTLGDLAILLPLPGQRRLVPGA